MASPGMIFRYFLYKKSLSGRGIFFYQFVTSAEFSKICFPDGAAGILDGVTITGNNSYSAEYSAAGADFLGAGIPPVVVGNIVTSTRSNYYRTLIYETIAKAMPPVITATTQFPETPTSENSVIITARITDNYNDIGLAVIYADVDGEFAPFAMYDDGNHHDGSAGDSGRYFSQKGRRGALLCLCRGRCYCSRLGPARRSGGNLRLCAAVMLCRGHRQCRLS